MQALMTHPDLAILAFAAVFGLAAALLAWLVSASMAATPSENRQYKDKPPLGFRCTWLLVQWISHALDPFLPQTRKDVLRGRLRKAGLEYALSPVQFLSGRLVCAAFIASVCCAVLSLFAPGGAGQNGIRGAWYAEAGAAGLLLGWFYPAIWLKDKLLARRNQMLKTLPFYLDIITLCVEAGLNLQGALNQAVEKGPKGVLREEFQRVLRDIRAGKVRHAALRGMADRLGETSVNTFISSIIQAENMGMNLGPVLRAQADQRRSERFLRAEKLAMEAPVKLLFPLIAFIFPCTFIVLFFPLAMKFMASGL